MDLIPILFSLALGSGIVIIIDVVWWRFIDFKKAEKGMEIHEHYHITFELFIVAILVNHFTSFDWLSYLLISAGFTFFVAEWAQGIEVQNRKVQPGHPFTIGSNHLKQSTILGVILLGITIFLYFYLV